MPASNSTGVEGRDHRGQPDETGERRGKLVVDIRDRIHEIHEEFDLAGHGDDEGASTDDSDEDTTWVGTDRPYWIYEGVTRSGVTIARTYQLARWTDGATRLWSGRRTTTGAGELRHPPDTLLSNGGPNETARPNRSEPSNASAMARGDG